MINLSNCATELYIQIFCHKKKIVVRNVDLCSESLTLFSIKKKGKENCILGFIRSVQDWRCKTIKFLQIVPLQQLLKYLFWFCEKLCCHISFNVSHILKKSHGVKYGGYSYLPTPPLGQDMTQGQFLSGV